VRIDTDVRKSVGSRERLVSTNVINNIVWWWVYGLYPSSEE
jgi:hypothetical protein